MRCMTPTLANLDLNLLVLLRALLAERSVTRAAARVGLSQSAASHALARLRDIYGDPLLVRSGRGLEATPRALALGPILERCLAELEGTVAGPTTFDPRSSRRAFSFGLADYGQALLVGPLLTRLSEEAPGIDLEVSSLPDLVDLVQKGELDLAVVVQGDLRSNLSATTLLKDTFACIVRRDHPVLGQRRKLDLSAYLELRHVVVAPTGSPGSIVDTVLARRGLARRVAARIPSFLAAPFVVATTDMINTGPARLAERFADLHPVRVLPPPLELPTFHLRLVWHRRFDQDPAHRWLRTLISSVARSQ